MLDMNKVLVAEKLNKDFIAEADSERMVRKTFTKYYLYNVHGNHHLEIRDCINGAKIRGSWRKWYFGNDSIKDLNPFEIVKVAQEISAFTGLTFNGIIDGSLLLVELGFTFLLPINPSSITDSIFRYSTFELGRYDTSLSFQGNDYWFVLYDKTKEINRWKKKWGEPEIDNGCHALRIELKAFKQTAFRNKLREIKTIRDIIKHYRMLIVSIFNEIKRLEMKPINLVVDNVCFEGRKKRDLRCYLMFLGMERKGIRRTFEYIKQLEVNKSAKNSMREELNDIIAIYDHCSPFKREDFISGVIKKQLAKKLSEPVPFIV